MFGDRGDVARAVSRFLSLKFLSSQHIVKVLLDHFWHKSSYEILFNLCNDFIKRNATLLERLGNVLILQPPPAIVALTEGPVESEAETHCTR